ncbi:MAG: hypothetical protein HY269_07075 [Deltaproteobacteria bacterium]|nr:hypothetical protein [Deltaproteobacteria bacterium]
MDRISSDEAQYHQFQGCLDIGERVHDRAKSDPVIVCNVVLLHAKETRPQREPQVSACGAGFPEKPAQAM